MVPMRTAGNEKGFTLIELLVYISLLLIVLGTLYTILITNTKTYSSQENKVEMTQDLRAAMELMVTEIRMAGCDPTGAGIFGFVDDADDNLNTDANSIHFTKDTDTIDGVLDNSEDISYYLTTSGGVQRVVRRLGDGTTPMVANNITGLTFLYGFADGSTGTPDMSNAATNDDFGNVRRVQITITGQTAQEDAVTGAFKTRTQASWVVIRNAGLL